MAVENRATRTIYHRVHGAASLFVVDARHALTFKDEWSATPWARNGDKIEPSIPIPDGWENGSASERIALALRLGADRKGLTAAKADELITTEVERRLAAETPEAEQSAQ